MYFNIAIIIYDFDHNIFVDKDIHEKHVALVSFTKNVSFIRINSAITIDLPANIGSLINIALEKNCSAIH